MDHGQVLANDTLSGLRARFPIEGADGSASLEALFLALTGRSLRD
jgi:hypothetical protein